MCVRVHVRIGHMAELFRKGCIVKPKAFKHAQGYPARRCFVTQRLEPGQNLAQIKHPTRRADPRCIHRSGRVGAPCNKEYAERTMHPAWGEPKTALDGLPDISGVPAVAITLWRTAANIDHENWPHRIALSHSIGYIRLSLSFVLVQRFKVPPVLREHVGHHNAVGLFMAQAFKDPDDKKRDGKGYE